MDDQLMTVRQLAKYLSLNERTVLKLVQEGSLPGVKLGNQWRFRKAMIDTWLDDQMLGLTPRYIDATQRAAEPRESALESCFKPAHVVSLQATTKTSVIVELAAFAQQLGLVRDETWFVGALIQRENVMPSANGNGLAFPHTLRRHPEQIPRPFMLLGRSQVGVDFDSLDGLPTHLFFVLGLHYEELQLPWLGTLARRLARPHTARALLDAPDGQAVFDIVLAAERETAPEPAQKPLGPTPAG